MLHPCEPALVNFSSAMAEVVQCFNATRLRELRVHAEADSAGDAVDQFVVGLGLPPESFDTITNSTARYSLHSLRNNTQRESGLVAFRLEEAVLPARAHLGGSNFYAQTVSADGAVSTCQVADLFNGTYVISCVNAGDGVLHLMLSHVAYGAFVPLSGGLILQDMRLPLLACKYAVRAPDALATLSNRTCSRNELADEFGGSWKDFKYVPTSGCAVKDVDLATCLKVLPKLVMIGSSHMRFMYDALIQKLGYFRAGLDVKHSDDAVENVEYRSKHYLVHGPEFPTVGIVDALRNLTLTLPRKAVLLLQFGSWDLHGNGLSATLDYAMIDVMPLLEQLITQLGTVVIFLPPPSYYLQTGTWAGMRNNHAYAALANPFRRELERLGGFMFDDLTMTRALMEAVPGYDWQTGDHILRNRGGEIFGRLGLECLRVLLAFIADLTGCAG